MPKEIRTPATSPARQESEKVRIESRVAPAVAGAFREAVEPFRAEGLSANQVVARLVKAFADADERQRRKLIDAPRPAKAGKGSAGK